MKKYLLIGSLIGLIQIIDAVILYAHNGAAIGISNAIAGLEFIWVIVSLVVIFRVKHFQTRLLAGAFLGYAISGIITGIFLVIDAGTPNAASDMPIPIWSVLAGGIFGLVYSLSSIYVLSKLKQHSDTL